MMTFPKESIEFTEQFPDVTDQQGVVEGLSELSRFRIRRAFKPVKVVRFSTAGVVTYSIDPILDRHIVASAGVLAGQSVIVQLPHVENADACAYTITRSDPHGVTTPLNVTIVTLAGDGSSIQGVELQFLSVQGQSISLQSNGSDWFVV